MNPITFFVLGAAKSGTTSLHNHLQAHPRISMARVKETNYFVDRNRRVSTLQDLQEQFSDSSEIVHRGDSSHMHLTCAEPVARVHAECPDARFLLVLRDPVERAHSLYLHNRRMGVEPAHTFERALELESSRAGSKRFARRSPEHPAMFRYVETGRYDEQLQRYFDLFPRERFLIHTFEEFREDPERVVLEAHRFLGVEPTPLMTYPVAMRNNGIPVLAPIARRISNSYNRGSSFRRALATQLVRWRRDVPEMQPTTRADLREQLEPSVRRLSSMLDRPPMWWTAHPESENQP